MSDLMKDGGAAFPVSNEANVNGQCGMSLRDWFAGMALQGLLASLCDEQSYHNLMKSMQEGGYEETHKAVSASAYAHADAMLAAREKGATP